MTRHVYRLQSNKAKCDHFNSELDSNHQVFYQSTHNHPVVRSKACEERAWCTALYATSHHRQQQRRLLSQINLQLFCWSTLLSCGHWSWSVEPCRTKQLYQCGQLLPLAAGVCAGYPLSPEWYRSGEVRCQLGHPLLSECIGQGK